MVSCVLLCAPPPAPNAAYMLRGDVLTHGARRFGFPFVSATPPSMYFRSKASAPGTVGALRLR